MGMNDTKERILKILSGIKREGINELISYLNESGFFTAKCSSKHHLSVVGGLATHSYHVYKNFKHKNERWNLNIPEDSVKIISLLHDVCKLEQEDKSKHGSKSVEILERFITLTEEEKLTIKYHMGLFSVFGYENFKPEEVHQAIDIYPSVQTFASTDMECTVYEDAGIPKKFKEIESNVKSALAEIQQNIMGE